VNPLDGNIVEADVEILSMDVHHTSHPRPPPTPSLATAAGMNAGTGTGTGTDTSVAEFDAHSRSFQSRRQQRQQQQLEQLRQCSDKKVRRMQKRRRRRRRRKRKGSGDGCGDDGESNEVISADECDADASSEECDMHGTGDKPEGMPIVVVHSAYESNSDSGSDSSSDSDSGSDEECTSSGWEYDYDNRYSTADDRDAHACRVSHRQILDELRRRRQRGESGPYLLAGAGAGAGAGGNGSSSNRSSNDDDRDSGRSCDSGSDSNSSRSSRPDLPTASELPRPHRSLSRVPIANPVSEPIVTLISPETPTVELLGVLNVEGGYVMR